MNTIVVLNNGGAQRGHSVFYQDKVYNNKHFGSASCLGSATFFGPMFIMDPMQFTQEYNLNWMKLCTLHTDCLLTYCRLYPQYHSFQSFKCTVYKLQCTII